MFSLQSGIGYRFLCFRSFNYTVDFQLFSFVLLSAQRKQTGICSPWCFAVDRPAESDKECFDQCQRLFHVGGNAKSQAKMSRDITVSHGTSSAESTCFLSVYYCRRLIKQRLVLTLPCMK